MVAPTDIYKMCGCGHTYTREEWTELPFVGSQVTSDETGVYLLEMRNCPCDSTIAVEHKVEPKKKSKKEVA